MKAREAAAMKLVMKDGMLLDVIPEDLKDNPYITLVAVLENIQALQYAKVFPESVKEYFKNTMTFKELLDVPLYFKDEKVEDEFNEFLHGFMYIRDQMDEDYYADIKLEEMKMGY